MKRRLTTSSFLRYSGRVVRLSILYETKVDPMRLSFSGCFMGSLTVISKLLSFAAAAGMSSPGDASGACSTSSAAASASLASPSPSPWFAPPSKVTVSS